jgi:glycosyltransferase involved in cell wall biosynthesis
VETFLEMGWSVVLTGEPDAIDGNWTEAGIKRLEGLGAVRVVLPGTRLIDKAMSKASAYLVRRLRAGNRFSNGNRCPTYLRSHFGRLHREIKPQLVFVNYATYAGVVDELPGCTPRILEIHDLISVNKKQRELLAQHQDSGRPNREALDENFYNQHRFAVEQLEVEAIAEWPIVISISSVEADRIRESAPHSKVEWIPAALPLPERSSNRQGRAVFLAGPNPFNVQASWYLIERVLSAVLDKHPNFQLEITGKFSLDLPERRGLVRSGFVREIEDVLGSAKFMPCPVTGGTGQQLKVIEAMAWGVPPILLEAGCRGAPVVHGKNGLIAKNADEFAKYCCELWSDDALRTELGEAARSTVAEHYGRKRLVDDMTRIVRMAEVP